MIKKLLGHIGIDSGTVFIGDPCYLRNEVNPDDISDAIQKAWDKNISYASMKHYLGHEGLGIVCTSGDGDGTYPVYGLFKTDNPVEAPYQIIIDFERCEYK